MMSQPILDMRQFAAQDATDADTSPGLFDKLIDGLMKLPQDSAADTAEQMLERADSYADSQPSFAEDLRAAVA